MAGHKPKYRVGDILKEELVEMYVMIIGILPHSEMYQVRYLKSPSSFAYQSVERMSWYVAEKNYRKVA